MPSPDVTRAMVLEKGDIAELRDEAEEEKSDREEESGDEEESEEVEGNDEDEGDDEEVDDEEVDDKEVKEKEVQEEGHDDEWLNYGLGPSKGSPLALRSRSCSRIRSQAQIVDYVDSGSDKVFFSQMPVLSPLYFLLLSFLASSLSFHHL